MERHLEALAIVGAAFGFLAIVGIAGLFAACYFHRKAKALRREEEPRSQPGA
jgi:hypothetical protein